MIPSLPLHPTPTTTTGAASVPVPLADGTPGQTAPGSAQTSRPPPSPRATADSRTADKPTADKAMAAAAPPACGKYFGVAALPKLKHVRPAFSVHGALPSALYALHVSLPPLARERLQRSLCADMALDDATQTAMWQWAGANPRGTAVLVDNTSVDRCALASNLYGHADGALRAALRRGERGVVELMRGLCAQAEASDNGEAAAAIAAASRRIDAAQTFCQQTHFPSRQRLTVLLLAWGLPQALTPGALRQAFAAATALADSLALNHPDARLNLLRAAGHAHTSNERKLLWQTTASTFVAAAAAADASDDGHGHSDDDAGEPATMLNRYAEVIATVGGAEAKAAAADVLALPWREAPAAIRAQLIVCLLQLAPTQRRRALVLLADESRKKELTAAVGDAGELFLPPAALVPGDAEADATDTFAQVSPHLAVLLAAYSMAAAPAEARCVAKAHPDEFFEHNGALRHNPHLVALLRNVQDPVRTTALRVLNAYIEIYNVTSRRALDFFFALVHRADVLNGASVVTLLDATRQSAFLSRSGSTEAAEEVLAVLLTAPLPTPRALLRPLLQAFYPDPRRAADDDANLDCASRLRALVEVLQASASDAERGATCAVLDVACRGLFSAPAAKILARRLMRMNNRARLQFLRLSIEDRQLSRSDLAYRCAALDQAAAHGSRLPPILEAQADQSHVQDPFRRSDEEAALLDLAARTAGKTRRPSAPLRDTAPARNRRRRALLAALGRTEDDVLARQFAACVDQVASWCAQIGHTSADADIDGEDIALMAAAHANLQTWQAAGWPEPTTGAARLPRAMAVLWQAFAAVPTRLPYAEAPDQAARWGLFFGAVAGAAVGSAAPCCIRATLDDIALLWTHMRTRRPLPLTAVLRLQKLPAAADH